MKLRALVLFGTVLLATALAGADTIVFKNGDKVTGKVKSYDGTKLVFTTAEGGDITADIKDVSTFSTDDPIEIRTMDGRKMNIKVTAGDADSVKAPDGSAIPLATVTKINPPPEVWTGSFLLNGTMVRGNTFSDTLGIEVNAGLRRNNDNNNDRITLTGDYNYGRSRDPATGVKSTSVDNWLAEGKYDYFFKFDPKFYAYGDMKAEHDRIALLNYRLSPGVGVGYQWFEGPKFNLNTEGGLTYIYEDHTDGSHDDNIALRLAYHVDKALNDQVKVFHNLEWLPAIDDPGDYLLTTDIGLHADITTSFFTEIKAEFKRDSTPAPGALKNDMRYVLGIGWKF